MRNSLTIRPSKNTNQLIRRIEEHKRLEDNQLQGKGKAVAAFQYQKEHQPEVFQLRPRREAREQNLDGQAEGVNMAFKEPVQKVLERIKHESYF